MQAKIKTIIWDLDNTLYKFTNELIWQWHAAVVRYAQSQGADISMEEGLQLAHKGWTEHRNSNHYFIKDYGLQPRDAHMGMFKHLEDKVITPCIETPTLMEDMRGHRHVILTYGTKDWARRVLDYTSLTGFFQPDDIFGAEDYNFEDKAHSPRGILMALDKIGGNPDDTMFVEDTLPNLKTAKENAGIYTAFLHHNRPLNDNDMGFVDLAVQDTPELLKWFKKLPQD